MKRFYIFCLVLLISISLIGCNKNKTPQAKQLTVQQVAELLKNQDDKISNDFEGGYTIESQVLQDPLNTIVVSYEGSNSEVKYFSSYTLVVEFDSKENYKLKKLTVNNRDTIIITPEKSDEKNPEKDKSITDNEIISFIKKNDETINKYKGEFTISEKTSEGNITKASVLFNGSDEVNEYNAKYSISLTLSDDGEIKLSSFTIDEASVTEKEEKPDIFVQQITQYYLQKGYDSVEVVKYMLNDDKTELTAQLKASEFWTYVKNTDFITSKYALKNDELSFETQDITDNQILSNIVGKYINCEWEETWNPEGALEREGAYIILNEDWTYEIIESVNGTSSVVYIQDYYSIEESTLTLKTKYSSWKWDDVAEESVQEIFDISTLPSEIELSINSQNEIELKTDLATSSSGMKYQLDQIENE